LTAFAATDDYMTIILHRMLKSNHLFCLKLLVWETGQFE